MSGNEDLTVEKPASPSDADPIAARSNGSSMKNMSLLMDVSLAVTVELGRARMPLRQVLELQSGSVIELDRLAGDPVDVFVNNRLIARGEVVVVDDKFGVRVTELVDSGNGKAAS